MANILAVCIRNNWQAIERACQDSGHEVEHAENVFEAFRNLGCRDLAASIAGKSPRFVTTPGIEWDLVVVETSVPLRPHERNRQIGLSVVHVCVKLGIRCALCTNLSESASEDIAFNEGILPGVIVIPNTTTATATWERAINEGLKLPVPAARLAIAS